MLAILLFSGPQLGSASSFLQSVFTCCALEDICCVLAKRDLSPSDIGVFPKLLMRDATHLVKRDSSATFGSCLIDVNAQMPSYQRGEGWVVADGVPASCLSVIQEWNLSDNIDELEAMYGPIRIINETAIYAQAPGNTTTATAKRARSIGETVFLLADHTGA